MTIWRTPIMLAAAIVVSGGSAVAKQYPPATHLAVDPHTGLIQQIRAPSITADRILAAPVAVMLSEDGREISIRKGLRVGQRTYLIMQPDQKLSVEFRYGNGTWPYTEWVVKNTSDTKGVIFATLVLSVNPSADRLFFPAGEQPRTAIVYRGPNRTYSYGNGMPGIPTAMPLGQIYAPQSDWGLAFFAHMGARTPRLTTTISHPPGKIQVRITLRIPYSAHGVASRRLYFTVTRGGWRPALGAVLARFPHVFAPRSMAYAALGGPFDQSWQIPPPALIRNWRVHGVRVVEIHGTYSFYGRYVPHHARWTPHVDDTWHWLKSHLPPGERPPDDASWQTIRAFVEHVRPRYLTRAKVNGYIHFLHTLGIKGLIYFNPSEAWAPWAKSRFPHDRVTTARGYPVPAWRESVEMVPNRHSAWGKYLLREVRGVLRMYPHIDGIFFDQANAGGRQLEALSAAACGLVHAAGKICWWNNPDRVPLAQLADGMMSEEGGRPDYRQETNIIQYYGLGGKPIVSLGPATTAAYAQLLLHGIIPKPAPRNRSRFAARWSALFRRLRTRSWVLTAHALTVASTVRANLFSTRNGNLVVPVVRRNCPGGVCGVLLGVKVAINTRNAHTIRAAYLLEPGLLGVHRLTLKQQGNTLRIVIPRLKAAALLVLARTGVFTGVTYRDLVRGRHAKIVWIVDNWTAAPQRIFLDLDHPRGASMSANVPPGGSKRLALMVEIPAVNGERRFETDAFIRRNQGKSRRLRVELPINSPLVLSVTAADRVRNRQGLVLRADLLLHSRRAQNVHVHVTDRGWRFHDVPRQVRLIPGKPTAIQFTGYSERVGVTRIRVVVTAAHGSVHAHAEVPVTVLGTALSRRSFHDIRSAELVLDEFGVGGGLYAHKPVYLNGVPIGDLPLSPNDEWMTQNSIPLSASAIRALRVHNDVRIKDPVNENFKIRDVFLRLNLRNGITVVTPVNRQVYTVGRGWLYGEGIQTARRQGLRGVRVNIPQPSPHSARQAGY